MADDSNPECCSIERANRGAKDETKCPACGHKGKPVPPVTIESLVREQARARVGRADGFRFCAEPGCEVAYFHSEGEERILTGEVRVAIGQKETGPKRTICYCFDYTALELEAQVCATGTSTIPDAIADKCKRGLERCEKTNPQGSCCLGNVRRVFEQARARGSGEVARSVRFSVAGMTCARSAETLQNRLASSSGVESARVDFESKQATVRLLPAGDTSRILAAIEEQGFQGRLKPSPGRAARDR